MWNNALIEGRLKLHVIEPHPFAATSMECDWESQQPTNLTVR